MIIAICYLSDECDLTWATRTVIYVASLYIYDRYIIVVGQKPKAYINNSCWSSAESDSAYVIRPEYSDCCCKIGAVVEESSVGVEV